jgi:ATP-dependent RNA helicase DDX18/HAS1
MKRKKGKVPVAAKEDSVEVTEEVQENVPGDSAGPKKKQRKMKVKEQSEPQDKVASSGAAASADDVEESGDEPCGKNADGGSGDESSVAPPKANTPGFLSDNKFSDLPLSEGTQSALAAMGFSHMTKIQDKSVQALLSGKDLLGAAKTGSGKVSSSSNLLQAGNHLL